MENTEQWVYYLKMQKDLNPDYFLLDQKLKRRFKSLVPVHIRTLVESVDKRKCIHVVIVIKSVSDYQYFNRRVKKIMKYLVRTGKVNLYVASSFSGINDSTIMKRDFYNFVKLPVQVNYLCDSISEIVDIKETHARKWPGGVRSSFKATG